MGNVFLRLVWHLLERVLHTILHNIADTLLIKPLTAFICDHAGLIIGLALLAGAIWGVVEQSRAENLPRR